jgi:hypothetical protein
MRPGKWSMVFVMVWGACGSNPKSMDVTTGAAGVDGAADSDVGGQGGAGGLGQGGGADGGIDGALPTCPGIAPLPPGQRPCRTTDDCRPYGGFCVANYVPGQACGACFPSPHECDTDAACGPGKVCDTGPMVACQCMGPGKVCVPRCTALSCASDQVCDETTGHCGPRSCTAGYACLAGTTCAADRSAADVHGCAIARCSTDGYACSATYACAPGPQADAHQCAPVLCGGGGYTCPDGSTCAPGPDADVRGCVPLSCVGGGYRCSLNTNCVPDSTEPHHCGRRKCTSDRQCDCGACVEGACRERLFVCSGPSAA